MKKRTLYYIVTWFLMSTFQLNAQNSYLDKEVNLLAGKKTIKETLKLFSNQTGCIFSYDPSIIDDNQIVSFSSKTKLTLRLALTKILPKSVDVKTNGKYIVLKNNETLNVTIVELQPIKTKNLNSTHQKIEGKIDSKLVKERLVLPPMTIKVETLGNKNVLETEIKLNVDTTLVPEIAIDNKQNDSVIIAQNAFLQKNIMPVVAIQSSNDTVKIENNKDTLHNEKSSFYKYLSKTGFLEIGLGYNNRLGAVFLQCGLYNIYSILSIGTDNNKSYLLGVGAGAKFRLKNHLSINLDFLRNVLIAGKSYELNVRSSNTQFSPIFNYTIGRNFKVFGGPTFNVIKSSYVSSVSTSDLGMLVAVGISVGVKVDLINIIFSRS